MSTRLVFDRVRRALAGVGGATAASTMPPAVEGRPDDYRLAASKVVEGAGLAVRAVGGAEPLTEPVAFLDGTQRYEIVSYLDTSPVVAGVVAAAVRLRTGGEFRTITREERRILVGRPEALEVVAPLVDGFDRVEARGEGRLHPLKELEFAHRAIDDRRSALERSVGQRFRRSHPDCWLVVDGVLPDEDQWATDPHAIGVSKSHATLPFGGDDLPTYLSVPEGHRTSVFEPATGRSMPVHSWGLRLWPYAGKDLLHGLVRVEVAATADPTARADRLSRWLLAERAPLSRPDPRWDRLLYGVAAVERHLRAR